MEEKAIETLKKIRKAIDKGYEQVETGELLESDVIESIAAEVDIFFRENPC